jgi:hypothetical protein
MSKQSVVVLVGINDNLGQILQSHITEMLYMLLGNTFPRYILNETCRETYRNLVKQIIDNTSDDYSDFCLNLLSLPNFNGLPYVHGEHHPFAYCDEKHMAGLNFAIRQLGTSLFFSIAKNKPSGMYLNNINYIDTDTIGLLYKQMVVESVL